MTAFETHTSAPGLPSLSWARRAGLVVVVMLLVVLQTSFFSHLSWRGVVPDLAMLAVVGVAMVRGPMPAMLLGFAAGLLLDVAPPADHVAGRWALALVVVGLVAGVFGANERVGVSARVVLVAGCSFVATSIVALTGLLVDDLQYSIGDLLAVVAIALLLDVLASFVVLPLMRWLVGGHRDRARMGVRR